MWRLGEARLCTGLHNFCIVKTMDFATSHMHGGSMEARGGPPLYGPPPLLHCKSNGFCNISYATWRLHGGSWRPVSVEPPPLLHCKKQWILQYLICHGGSMEARGGPSLYGPPTLLHYKNNGFCNISYAMEAPWRLVEARLCTGLQRLCIAKTMDFATSHMPWTLHGGSWRPVSVRASTAFAL